MFRTIRAIGLISGTSLDGIRGRRGNRRGTVLTLLGYGYRVRVEEQVLCQALGQP